MVVGHMYIFGACLIFIQLIFKLKCVGLLVKLGPESTPPISQVNPHHS